MKKSNRIPVSRNRQTQRTLRAVCHFALLLLVAGFAAPMENQAKQEQLSYKISRGMDVKILKNTEIPFIHAQLVIYYKEQPTNPAIPYLTMLNLFSRQLGHPNNSLLNTLKRLGNDYHVEHRPDFLLFKINFLPHRMGLFIRFLRILFSSKPMLENNAQPATLQQRRRQNDIEIRCHDSIDNYWQYFFKTSGWKKRIAYQLAYHHLFPNTILGQTFITPNHLKNLNIDHLRTFYRQTYILPNTLLVLKGNIDNPAVVYGSLERTFASAKKPKIPKYPIENIKITNSKKIYIFDTRTNEAPEIFWMEPIDTRENSSPIPHMVLNHLLFGFPTGRIYLTANRYMNIHNLRMQSELINHENVSVISNHIRLKYRDIEKFILLAQREKNKFSNKGVEKKELLDTLTYIYGRLKVNTREIGNDVSTLIVQVSVQNPQATPAIWNKENKSLYEPVIVIVGNAQIILRYLTVLSNQVEVINFKK